MLGKLTDTARQLGLEWPRVEAASSAAPVTPPAGGTSETAAAISINLDTATPEELARFIRRQTAHIGKLEQRCREVIAAYKTVTEQRQRAVQDLAALQESHRNEVRLQSEATEQLQLLAESERAERERAVAQLRHVEEQLDATKAQLADAVRTYEAQQRNLNRELAEKAELQQLVKRLQTLRKPIDSDSNSVTSQSSTSLISSSNSSSSVDHSPTRSVDSPSVDSSSNHSSVDSSSFDTSHRSRSSSPSRSRSRSHRSPFRSLSPTRSPVSSPSSSASPSLSSSASRSSSSPPPPAPSPSPDASLIQQQLTRVVHDNDELLRRVQSLEEAASEAARSRQSLEQSMAAQQQQHSEALAQLQGEHVAALAQLRREHDEAVAQLQGRHVEALAQLQRRHDDAVVQLQRRHEETAAQREREHAEQLAAHERAKQKTIEKLSLEHRKALAQLERSNLEAIEQLRQRQQEQVAEAATETTAAPSSSTTPPLPSGDQSELPAVGRSVSSYSLASNRDRVSVYALHRQDAREREQQSYRSQVLELSEKVHELQSLLAIQAKERLECEERILDLERHRTREQVNLEYLKNIIVKALEHPAEQQLLVPVLSTLLQFSPAEMQRIQTGQAARPPPPGPSSFSMPSVARASSWLFRSS